MTAYNTQKHYQLVILQWLIITIIGIILFFSVLRNYFYYDDFIVLGNLMRISRWQDAILAQFNAGYGFRFLEDFFVWSRFRLFGWSTIPYFVNNILQHLIVSILVYILAFQIYKNRLIAFLASILFVTMFAHQQIVTWITGSNVSLLTIFYLAALIAFIQYISCGRIVWYLLAFFFYVCALAVGEYAITLSLMLIGVSVLLYLETKKNKLRSFLAMLPFGLVLIPYFWIQTGFFQKGTSQGAVMGGYALGGHIFANFTNLAYLIIPDLFFPRVKDFLNQNFPLGIQLITFLDPLTKILGIFLTIWILIKGSLRSKYWLFWIFLTFAPFTLWVDSELVHAPRYLYLPSIGFCILLADLLNKVVHWPKLEKILSPKVSLVGMIILWAIANAGPLYIFQIQENESGKIRRTIVEQIQLIHPQFPPNSHIFIGVPNYKFRDLEWGIPDFYDEPIKVTIIPPGKWPDQLLGNQFAFVYLQKNLNEFTKDYHPEKYQLPSLFSDQDRKIIQPVIME